MIDYIKLFEKHSDYEEYINSGDAILPNVSCCEDQPDVVHYSLSWAKEYFTIYSLEDNNTIYLKAANSAITRTVSVSSDNGKTWTAYTSSTGANGTTLATLNKGEKLLVKGENSTYASSISNYNQFKTTGQFEIKGNIMSLVSGDLFADIDKLTETYTFCQLFYGCNRLISAENLILPATTLAQYCYRAMFSGCTGLTTAPSILPATTLAQNCYDWMFSGCTGLTTAPELPATTLSEHCYEQMFQGCTSLTTAPSILPATTLIYDCYGNMFSGCTGLTTAPELPATTLAEYCYLAMFQGCTSLTTAPELPATTLAEYCYDSMFSGCTNLTTAPVLPATTLADGCYDSMFSGCSSLNYIKAMFTTDPQGVPATWGWVQGVSDTGTFVKNSEAEWDVIGEDGIPDGWTVETASE